MWHCLYNSLTKEAKVTLLTYCKDYEILINGEPKIVAPLMYKTIMRLATLYSKELSPHSEQTFVSSRTMQ